MAVFSEQAREQLKGNPTLAAVAIQACINSTNRRVGIPPATGKSRRHSELGSTADKAILNDFKWHCREHRMEAVPSKQRPQPELAPE